MSKERWRMEERTRSNEFKTREAVRKPSVLISRADMKERVARTEQAVARMDDGTDAVARIEIWRG
jgi:hypothetical protein